MSMSIYVYILVYIMCMNVPRREYEVLRCECCLYVALKNSQ